MHFVYFEGNWDEVMDKQEHCWLCGEGETGTSKVKERLNPCGNAFSKTSQLLTHSIVNRLKKVLFQFHLISHMEMSQSPE